MKTLQRYLDPILTPENWWSKKENVERYVEALFDYQTRIFQRQHHGSPLSPHKLLVLSLLSLSNAIQFLTDAVVLFERESYAHSLALAVFGLEELGKSSYCYLAHKGWVNLEEFHQYMRKHDKKLEVMRSLDGIQVMRTITEDAEKKGKFITSHEMRSNPVLRRREAWWRKLSKLRMKALYVDYESMKSSPIRRREALEIIAKSRMYVLGAANTVLAAAQKPEERTHS
jgi:AbiV family abortive infection protein